MAPSAEEKNIWRRRAYKAYKKWKIQQIALPGNPKHSFEFEDYQTHLKLVAKLKKTNWVNEIQGLEDINPSDGRNVLGTNWLKDMESMENSLAGMNVDIGAGGVGSSFSFMSPHASRNNNGGDDNTPKTGQKPPAAPGTVSSVAPPSTHGKFLSRPLSCRTGEFSGGGVNLFGDDDEVSLGTVNTAVTSNTVEQGGGLMDFDYLRRGIDGTVIEQYALDRDELERITCVPQPLTQTSLAAFTKSVTSVHENVIKKTGTIKAMQDRVDEQEAAHDRKIELVQAEVAKTEGGIHYRQKELEALEPRMEQHLTKLKLQFEEDCRRTREDANVEHQNIMEEKGKLESNLIKLNAKVERQKRIKHESCGRARKYLGLVKDTSNVIAQFKKMSVESEAVRERMWPNAHADKSNLIQAQEAYGKEFAA